MLFFRNKNTSKRRKLATNLSKGCTVQCLGDHVLDLSMIVPAVSRRSSINVYLMTNPSYAQQPLSIPLTFDIKSTVAKKSTKVVSVLPIPLP